MSFSDTLRQGEVRKMLHVLGISFNNANSNEWVTMRSPIRDDDRNPSFSLNINKGCWKDFGVEQSGDLVTLVKIMRGLSTAEAIRYIKEQTDYIPLDYMSAEESQEFMQRLQANTKVKASCGGVSQAPPPKTKTVQWPDEDEVVLAEIISEALLSPTPQQRLEAEDHEILRQVYSYDLISKLTLLRYHCGITEEYGRDWLSIHYPSGTQLYRRADGQKQIRATKGSRPGESFFGIEQLTGKGTLLIAKSPREAMMLVERYGDVVDVIGIVTGEIGNLSANQTAYLQGNARQWHTVKVLFDCDTSQALEITKAFTKEVGQVLSGRARVEYVNVWELSGGQSKDLTDYLKHQRDLERVYADILARGTALTARKTEPKEILRKQVEITIARPHPENVYERLPKVLGDITGLIAETYHRDVLLNATLPVIAAHLPGVQIPHKDCRYSPDLYCLVIAKPGSGKGIAEKARGLGEMLNRHLVDESRKAKAAWDCLPKKEREVTSPPPLRQLFLPGNSSSRALYDVIRNNGSHGLIFETEIDTLINATRQEWGDFTDVIRKAFHHEPISIQRKGEEIYIARPQLSMFMSGTFDQFRRLFDSAENGHFSRNAFYTFEAPLRWRSHRPTEQSRQLGDKIRGLSQTLFEIYMQLKGREHPLSVHLEEGHWDQVDRTFRQQMQRLEQEQMSRYLQSSNQRSAVIAIRIAAIMCILRNTTEVHMKVLDRDSLVITDHDLAVGLQLATNFFDHAIRLYQLLPNISKWKAKGTKFESFYYRLPARFETKQAYYVGMDVQISKRTVRNYLAELTDEGALLKEEHGVYRKAEH